MLGAVVEGSAVVGGFAGAIELGAGGTTSGVIADAGAADVDGDPEMDVVSAAGDQRSRATK